MHLPFFASPPWRTGRHSFFVHAKTQRRQAAKGVFLCASPSLRDILFSREGTKPAYGRVTCFERSSFFVHAKAQRSKAAKGFLSSLATPLLCEIFFSSRKGVFSLLPVQSAAADGENHFLESAYKSFTMRAIPFLINASLKLMRRPNLNPVNFK